MRVNLEVIIKIRLLWYIYKIKGINLLITGTTFMPVVYGFYCQPILQYVYLISLTLLSLLVFRLALTDFIHTREYFVIKNIIYALFGSGTTIPVIHLIYLK